MGEWATEGETWAEGPTDCGHEQFPFKQEKPATRERKLSAWGWRPLAQKPAILGSSACPWLLALWEGLCSEGWGTEAL